jgi:hypothetical protein
MMWSPVIIAMAAMETDPDFDGSFTGGPNGYNEDDELVKTIMHFGMLANQTPPMNPWPQFAEFVSADPHYAQAVDPENFPMDFATLRWDRSTMDMRLSPGAMGQSLMKQYLWAQDMLGSFHDEDEEEVVPGEGLTPDHADGTFDPENGVYYGGDNLDGFVGQVLTAEAINKVKNLIESLAYDGGSLGGVDPMTYDPANGLQYFPHLIAVSEESVPGLPPRAGNYDVVDPRSDLMDQASLLWGAVNFKNMMDPHNNSDEAHLAYHSVFDGDPFPADMGSTGMPGPFDLMKGASKVVFLNLMAMHFDSDAGSFVDYSQPINEVFPLHDGQSGFDETLRTDQVQRTNYVTTLNAAYVLVALGVFQEEFAGTPLADMALDAIAAQAEFMIAVMGDQQDLYVNLVPVVAGGDEKGLETVEAQAAAVRGLYAAYGAMGNLDYRDAADRAYEMLIDEYYDPDNKAFHTLRSQPVATYNPLVVAVLSGALREARLVGGYDEATTVYTDFWYTVANKMQLAESMASGEMGNDSDGDGIPFIPEQIAGLAPVFAPEAVMQLIDRNLSNQEDDAIALAGSKRPVVLHPNEPNPFNPQTVIRFELAHAGHVDLSVYDVRGQRVHTLVSQQLSAGSHEATFVADGISSGVYYYVLESGGRRELQKMLLLK